MKIVFFAFFLLSLSYFFNRGDDHLFRVDIPNEGKMEVAKSLNSSGDFVGYHAELKAPVCEEGVCYDVEVVFRWNLIGEFEGLDTLSGKPLTKLDHVPFEKADYQKLDEILKNQDLKFTHMKADELVVKSKLDAVSGATVAAIQNEVIEGALYTCHTLWHIANGAVRDSIERFTAKALDESLIKKVSNIPSNRASYYLLKSMDEHMFTHNLELILDLMISGDGYFAKNAFEEMPQSIFNDTRMVRFIEFRYSDFDYFTRIALLKRLKEVKVNSELVALFKQNLGAKPSGENVYIVDILISSENEEILFELKELAIQNKIRLLPPQLKALNQRLESIIAE